MKDIMEGKAVVDLTDNSLIFLSNWSTLSKKVKSQVIEIYRSEAELSRSVTKLRRTLDNYVLKYLPQIKGALDVRGLSLTRSEG